jgi:hypothetical protein
MHQLTITQCSEEEEEEDDDLLSGPLLANQWCYEDRLIETSARRKHGE